MKEGNVLMELEKGVSITVDTAFRKYYILQGCTILTIGIVRLLAYTLVLFCGGWHNGRSYNLYLA